ncbi:MAG: hypothetical protein V1827_02415 [Candidatus Micrarchaeota archaeon]
MKPTAYRREGISRREFGAAAAATLGIALLKQLPMAEARAAGYSTSTDPFTLDAKLKAIAAGLPAGSTANTVQAIFDRLRRGVPGGVKILKMTGRQPHTASEALAKGGDCTDLARIVTALFKAKGIPGGALYVHFERAPANIDHVVPFALIGGKKVIVDLMTSVLGQTHRGKFKLLMEMTHDESAGIYHREQGDHFRDNKNPKSAMAAYKRSLEINDKDPYVHQNLGILYEKSRDFTKALQHIKKAAQLDKAYGKHLPKAVFNAATEDGEKAYNDGRFADCASEFQKALDSGIKLPPAQVKSLNDNIALCKGKAREKR